MTSSESQRLRRLETAESARDAISQYCLALDTGDLELLRRVFAEDIVLERAPDQPLRGREAVLGFFAESLSHTVEQRKHYHTNPLVTHTGDGTAFVRSYFFALHFDGGALSVAWGAYRLGVRVLDGAGVIAELTIGLEMPIAPMSGMLGGS